MKTLFKIILPSLLLILAIASCGPAKIPTGPDGPPRAQFAGSWTLTGVTFSNVKEEDVPKVFDAGTPGSFTNSTWVLNNDGSGYYTLANGTKQNIYWAVNSGDALGALFTFTDVAEGQKPTDKQLGYQLVISSTTPTAMVLKHLQFIGAKNGYVVYTFAKQQ
jgi:hypothetical protein